jgi:hypothetical protein
MNAWRTDASGEMASTSRGIFRKGLLRSRSTNTGGETPRRSRDRNPVSSQYSSATSDTLTDAETPAD